MGFKPHWTTPSVFGSAQNTQPLSKLSSVFPCRNRSMIQDTKEANSAPIPKMTNHMKKLITTSVTLAALALASACTHTTVNPPAETTTVVPAPAPAPTTTTTVQQPATTTTTTTPSN
jgi:hypothetical protein